MIRLQVEHLHQPGGWASPGLLEIDDGGLIAAVHDAAPAGWTPDERVGGFGIPGVPNLHSHGFQRALAGRTEARETTGADNLWAWRREMYRFVAALEPDDLRDITAMAYLELVRGGFTQVGEFHYVHLDPRGGRYADPARTTWAIVEAAADVGIGLTLLPVLYRHGGVGRPLRPEQVRFALGVDEVLDIAVRARGLGDPLVTSGVAPHSLRATALDEIRALVQGWAPTGGPIHIHIAERPEEVAECRAVLGETPVRLLLDRIGADERWCLVHATHADADERAAIARAGAVVGLCPITEATVADGLFRLDTFDAAGGRWGIGTDSHYTTDAALELRCLELGQRLRLGRRNPLAEPEGIHRRSGRLLLDRALAAGTTALGAPLGALRPGQRADIVVLDAEHPGLAGHAPETALDAWILAGAASPIRDVMIGGRWVIRNGHHPRAAGIVARYRATMTRLFSEA